MFTNGTVVNIFQYINVSNQHASQHKFTPCYMSIIIPIKLGKNKMHVFFDPLLELLPNCNVYFGKAFIYVNKEVHTRTLYETIVILIIITKGKNKTKQNVEIINAVRNKMNNNFCDIHVISYYTSVKEHKYAFNGLK